MTHPYAEESVFEIESYMSARKPEVRKRDWRQHCDITSSNLVKTPPHKAKTRDQFSWGTINLPSVVFKSYCEAVAIYTLKQDQPAVFCTLSDLVSFGAYIRRFYDQMDATRLRKVLPLPSKWIAIPSGKTRAQQGNGGKVNPSYYKNIWPFFYMSPFWLS